MLGGKSSKTIYFYQLVTFGLYFFYWCARSRADIHRAAGKKLIPSTWLLAVPLANYWWIWQYASALEFVSYKRIKTADTFLLYVIGTSGWIIAASNIDPIIRSSYNSTVLNHPTTQQILVIGGIALAVLSLIGIIGVAFFCSNIQHKINALARPASPPPQARS